MIVVAALVLLSLAAVCWLCALIRRCRLWCERRASSHRGVKYGALGSADVYSLDAAEEELLSELGTPKGDEAPASVQWL